MAAESLSTGTLRQASINRLACLHRHWTWADEARARFERELAVGWEDDAEPLADHPFGSYYQWCALLCSLGEVVLDDDLLSRAELEPLRSDLQTSLPALRACRQLLVAIPASLEEHPHIVDLLRDDETLGRLRRLHTAFGEALREEHLLREFDSLDPDR